jgi:hypothetical protein
VVWIVVLLLALPAGPAPAGESPTGGDQSLQPVGPVSPPFPDVPKGHWAFEAVEKVRQAGIMIGYPDGTFEGGSGRSSRQVAPVFPRASHYPHLGAGPRGVGKARPLGTDSVSTVVWAKWPSVPAFGDFLNSGARGGRHVWRPYW